MRFLDIKMLRMPLRSLRRGRSGNVALIFGLVAFPLLGLVGAAVDFGLASSVKVRLDTALDSAALLATTTAANAVANGSSVAAAISMAQSLATARFTAQVSSLSAASVTGVSATVTSSSGSFNAALTYTANYTTSIGAVLGVGNIPLFGQSSTNLVTAPYADIHVMVDISTSMAIGATQTDMDTLGSINNAYLANPPVPLSSIPGSVRGQLPSCALSCHWTNAYPDFYTTAEAKGVTLRIDVVRSALGNMVSQLSALNTSGSFRMGLYTFNNAVNTIYALSSNISNATSVLPKVTVGIENESGPSPFAETDFRNAMYSVTNTVGVAGDGTSPSSPRKYLVIITDGVLDYYLGGARVISAADPSSCAQAKANGATVMILYTPYVPLMPPYVANANPTYTAAVLPVQANILPSLQSCASSPTMVWQASDTADVNSALTQILAIATKSPGHFTQ
jgi:Flp pilus assembly protein TadG